MKFLNVISVVLCCVSVSQASGIQEGFEDLEQKLLNIDRNLSQLEVELGVEPSATDQSSYWMFVGDKDESSGGTFINAKGFVWKKVLRNIPEDDEKKK